MRYLIFILLLLSSCSKRDTSVYTISLENKNHVVFVKDFYNIPTGISFEIIDTNLYYLSNNDFFSPFLLEENVIYYNILTIK